MNIEQAASGNSCPYCGGKKHKECEQMKSCHEVDLKIPKSDKWAIHKNCGKVLIMSRKHGLCLIEGDDGIRYVVPITSLQFGGLSAIIELIESTTLAQEELESLLNLIRLKAKDFKQPQHPELWPGCVIEIQLGQHIKQATVQGRNGPCYWVLPEGSEEGVNVSPKSILRIV